MFTESYKSFINIFTFISISSLLIFISFSASSDPTDFVAPVTYPKLNSDFPGYKIHVVDDFANRCVPNVKWQIENNLHNGKNGGDIIAYASGLIGAPTKENNGLYKAGITKRKNWKHRQGVMRYHADGKNYFYVSSSVKKKWNKNAGFEVISWGDHFTSARLGSNINNDNSHAPSVKYRVINYIQAPSHHAGGMQIAGRFLAVPYHASKHFIDIYDLKNPANPKFSSRISSEKNIDFGFAALTRLNNGRYLAIGGDDKVEVFVTKGASLFTGWKSHSTHHPGSKWGDTSNYQNAQFVTDCSGKLYLIATHKSKGLVRYKKDWIDIWRTYVYERNGQYSIKLVKEGKRHMFCGGGDDQNWCNFQAGAGVYVDTTGKLIVYGIEHWNNGPKVNGIGSTKMKEFKQN